MSNPSIHELLKARRKQSNLAMDGGGGGSSETVTAEAIQAVLDGLDHSDDSLWTQAGLVQMSAIEAELGPDVSRADIDAASPNFERIIQE